MTVGRFMLKLFRDYAFHQVMVENYNPHVRYGAALALGIAAGNNAALRELRHVLLPPLGGGLQPAQHGGRGHGLRAAAVVVRIQHHGRAHCRHEGPLLRAQLRARIDRAGAFLLQIHRHP